MRKYLLLLLATLFGAATFVSCTDDGDTKPPAPQPDPAAAVIGVYNNMFVKNVMANEEIQTNLEVLKEDNTTVNLILGKFFSTTHEFNNVRINGVPVSFLNNSEQDVTFSLDEATIDLTNSVVTRQDEEVTIATVPVVVEGTIKKSANPADVTLSLTLTLPDEYGGVTKVDISEVTQMGETDHADYLVEHGPYNLAIQIIKDGQNLTKIYTEVEAEKTAPMMVSLTAKNLFFDNQTFDFTITDVLVDTQDGNENEIGLTFTKPIIAVEQLGLSDLTISPRTGNKLVTNIGEGADPNAPEYQLFIAINIAGQDAQGGNLNLMLNGETIEEMPIEITGPFVGEYFVDNALRQKPFNKMPEGTLTEYPPINQEYIENQVLTVDRSDYDKVRLTTTVKNAEGEETTVIIPDVTIVVEGNIATLNLGGTTDPETGETVYQTITNDGMEWDGGIQVMGSLDPTTDKAEMRVRVSMQSMGAEGERAVLDENDKPVFIDAVDENGNPVYDEQGNRVRTILMEKYRVESTVWWDSFITTPHTDDAVDQFVGGVKINSDLFVQYMDRALLEEQTRPITNITVYKQDNSHVTVSIQVDPATSVPGRGSREPYLIYNAVVTGTASAFTIEADNIANKQTDITGIVDDAVWRTTSYNKINLSFTSNPSSSSDADKWLLNAASSTMTSQNASATTTNELQFTNTELPTVTSMASEIVTSGTRSYLAESEFNGIPYRYRSLGGAVAQQLNIQQGTDARTVNIRFYMSNGAAAPIPMELRNVGLSRDADPNKFLFSVKAGETTHGQGTITITPWGNVATLSGYITLDGDFLITYTGEGPDPNNAAATVPVEVTITDQTAAEPDIVTPFVGNYTVSYTFATGSTTDREIPIGSLNVVKEDGDWAILEFVSIDNGQSLRIRPVVTSSSSNVATFSWNGPITIGGTRYTNATLSGTIDKTGDPAVTAITLSYGADKTIVLGEPGDHPLHNKTFTVHSQQFIAGYGNIPSTQPLLLDVNITTEVVNGELSIIIKNIRGGLLYTQDFGARIGVPALAATNTEPGHDSEFIPFIENGNEYTVTDGIYAGFRTSNKDDLTLDGTYDTRMTRFWYSDVSTQDPEYASTRVLGGKLTGMVIEYVPGDDIYKLKGQATLKYSNSVSTDGEKNFQEYTIILSSTSFE